MFWADALYIMTAFFSVAILTGMGIYAFRHRDVPGAVSFGCIMFSVPFWITAKTVIFLNPGNEEVFFFWVRFRAASMAITPVAWLAFSLEYSGRRKLISLRNVFILSAVPCVSILLCFTSDFHSLFFQNQGYDWGIWGWVHSSYSFFLMFTGMAIMAITAVRSIDLYRRQSMAIIIVSPEGYWFCFVVIPLSGNDAKEWIRERPFVA